MPRSLFRRATVVATTATIAAAGLTATLTSPAAVASAAPAPNRPTAKIAAPRLTVHTDRGGLAKGYLFTAPKIEGTVPDGAAVGPLISDNQGRPVWFKSLPKDVSATDVRVQHYRGQRVLTYWQGDSLAGAGHGEGVDHILNSHYRQIATVRARRGAKADQHEFWLTGRNTALITSYEEKTVDARSVGGAQHQKVLDGVVQEIDVKTGRVLLDWHSLRHIPLAASHQPVPTSADTDWDYFHVNAVRPDTDGNLIVSARHMWAVYKIARRSGRVIWQLGGKHSSFRLGRGVRFAWQHDPKPEGHGVYRIFDNESNGTNVRPQSRVITVRTNTRTHRATLLASVTHPQHLTAPSQGDSQLLPNGHLLVGWGALGRVSEFDRHGKLLYDATVPKGYDTYRAYRSPWVGRPKTRPSVSLAKSTLHLRWNGETGVRTWQVRGGRSRSALHNLRAVRWNGLDTVTTLRRAPRFLRVVALNAHGHVLGRSAITRS